MIRKVHIFFIEFSCPTASPMRGFFSFGRIPPRKSGGRALRCKSSRLNNGAVGFTLQSLALRFRLQAVYQSFLNVHYNDDML